MRLVVIDLTDDLLMAPGRSEARPGAAEMLEVLTSAYRLGAVADTETPGMVLRSALDEAGIGRLFDSVGTSADFGAPISPDVLQRVASAAGTAADHTAVVTARPQLAEQLEQEGIVALLVDGAHPLDEVPVELAWLATLRSQLH